MKSIFDASVREEIIARIDSVSNDNKAQWGKMNLCQMLQHCVAWDEWILGVKKPVYKQAFIGKLFGKMALKKVTGNDLPLGRNTPTTRELKITNTECDIAAEKLKWIKLISQYERYDNPGFVHAFFGKMTKEQIAIMAYKHSDHHLRQFGA